jgi:hypothetical protein
MEEKPEYLFSVIRMMICFSFLVALGLRLLLLQSVISSSSGSKLSPVKRHPFLSLHFHESIFPFIFVPAFPLLFPSSHDLEPHLAYPLCS